MAPFFWIFLLFFVFCFLVLLVYFLVVKAYYWGDKKGKSEKAKGKSKE